MMSAMVPPKLGGSLLNERNNKQQTGCRGDIGRRADRVMFGRKDTKEGKEEDKIAQLGRPQSLAQVMAAEIGAQSTHPRAKLRTRF